MSIDEWVGYGIPEEIIDEAIVWLTKLDSGEMSDQQKTEFAHWLDDDPNHRWAFEEVSTVWARSSIRHDTSVSKSKASGLTNHKNGSRYYASLSYIAIALVILGLVVNFL
ncbi:FecR/PupR family sigma factor regulator [Lacimicrobium sp. SS2-24]|uniref:FecR/PupR family sigma factor regulator n=1 Tax=Lacimicrobium sp. SS2-24 TaxID=2005569 RepID=UPI00143CBE59|nr:FecR/PupR family sigma factor regulator [Lacimicrobium sp. SS2-24]